MNIENKSGSGHAIFYITNGGYGLAQKISVLYPDAKIVKYTAGKLAEKWKSSHSIICIMAAGIVVRALAPLIEDKRTDPAVVVLDEKGRYAISLLSGHIGGANVLADELAEYLGGQAVITTSSDVQGKLSLDLWALEHDLYIEDFEKLKVLSAKIVNGHKVKLKSDCAMRRDRLPAEFAAVDSMKDADIIISERILDGDGLFLRPGNLSAGIGCNRGTVREEIEEVFYSVFRENKLSPHSVKSLASIDLKKDEQGLLDFARDTRLSIEFYSRDALNAAAVHYNIEASGAVMAATGAVAVAEPAALLQAEKISARTALILPKEKRGNVTLAIAKAEFTL